MEDAAPPRPEVRGFTAHMIIICMILLSIGGLVMAKYPIIGIALWLLAFKVGESGSPCKEEIIIPWLAFAAGIYIIIAILSNIFGWGIH